MAVGRVVVARPVDVVDADARRRSVIERDVRVERIGEAVALVRRYAAIGVCVGMIAYRFGRWTKSELDSLVGNPHVVGLHDQVAAGDVDHVLADATDAAFFIFPPMVDARAIRSRGVHSHQTQHALRPHAADGLTACGRHGLRSNALQRSTLWSRANLLEHATGTTHRAWV